MSKTMPYDLPKYIQIETTIHCNSDCDFCGRKKAIRNTPKMPDRLWRKIVDESRGWGVGYRPFMQNEPLIDPMLVEIVKYIKEDKTATVELNSNGELLNERLAVELLDMGLDMVRFSVDGHSPEVAEKIRPISYKKVRENIVRFLKMIRERNHHCETYVRMIDLPSNRHEQADYLKFWADLGAKSQITPLYTWAWNGADEPVLKPCPKILKEMFFYTDGRAVLCCWDVENRGVIGDVNETSVRDIWYGEVNRKYRELLAQGRRDQIHLCSRCDGFK